MAMHWRYLYAKSNWHPLLRNSTAQHRQSSGLVSHTRYKPEKLSNGNSSVDCNKCTLRAVVLHLNSSGDADAAFR